MDTIDGLAPEARFLLRTLHAGLALDEAAALLALDATAAAKRLRAAAARSGTDAPGSAAGQDALIAALAPLIDVAGRPPVRRPATPCLPDDVLGSLATRQLAGPLLLASAEHAADCPTCFEQVLARRGEQPAPARTGSPRRGGTVLAIVLITIVAVLLLLFV